MRPFFEEGDVVRLEGRCGKVLDFIPPGVLVEWWDGHRSWVEMGRLDNVMTGQAASAPPVEDEIEQDMQAAGPATLQATS